MGHRDIAKKRRRNLERFHQRSEERRAAGLCLKCGKSEPAPDRTLCEPCLEKRRAADREFDAYFGATIERRRRAPRDDIVSALAHAEDGGERLSEREMLNILRVLLVASTVRPLVLTPPPASKPWVSTAFFREARRQGAHMVEQQAVHSLFANAHAPDLLGIVPLRLLEHRP